MQFSNPNREAQGTSPKPSFHGVLGKVGTNFEVSMRVSNNSWLAIVIRLNQNNIYAEPHPKAFNVWSALKQPIQFDWMCVPSLGGCRLLCCFSLSLAIFKNRLLRLCAAPTKKFKSKTRPNCCPCTVFATIRILSLSVVTYLEKLGTWYLG